MAIEQWLSNETKTPKPYVERGSIRDRPNAGGAGDLVRLLHAGRISTVNEGTPYSGRGFYNSCNIRWCFISNSGLRAHVTRLRKRGQGRGKDGDRAVVIK